MVVLYRPMSWVMLKPMATLSPTTWTMDRDTGPAGYSLARPWFCKRLGRLVACTLCDDGVNSIEESTKRRKTGDGNAAGRSAPRRKPTAGEDQR